MLLNYTIHFTLRRTGERPAKRSIVIAAHNDMSARRLGHKYCRATEKKEGGEASFVALTRTDTGHHVY